MKKRTIFTALFRIMGVMVLVLGIRMVGEGIYHYIDEHNQKDWISATAYVIDISGEYVSSRRNKNVNYDITYEYEVDGEKYTDNLYNRSRAMGIGDQIKIKYDPEMPEKSTDILLPSLKNLFIFLIFGAILITAGFFLSGAWALIRKMRRGDKPEEEDIHPPEESVIADEEKSASQKPVHTMIRKVVAIAVSLGCILLGIKLFPGVRSIETTRFIEIVEEAGYTTSDTTEELSQTWRVGSMLEEAASLNDGNIRMDFVVMDTAGSARALFNGMELPVSDGKVEEHSGMVHERYSAENETLYAAKIRIRDTVIYVSAQMEHKLEAVKLLDELGYWKE